MYIFCVPFVQAQQSTKGLLAALPPAALLGQLHQATILCCCSLHSTKPSNLFDPVIHVRKTDCCGKTRLVLHVPSSS